MNVHFKSLRHAAVAAVAAATAVVWGIAELIALQRARIGSTRR